MSQLIGLQNHDFSSASISRYLPCVTRPAELQYQFGVEFRAGVGLDMGGPWGDPMGHGDLTIENMEIETWVCLKMLGIFPMK